MNKSPVISHKINNQWDLRCNTNEISTNDLVNHTQWGNQPLSFNHVRCRGVAKSVHSRSWAGPEHTHHPMEAHPTGSQHMVNTMMSMTFHHTPTTTHFLCGPPPLTACPPARLCPPFHWTGLCQANGGVTKGQRSRREWARPLPLVPHKQGLRAMHSSRNQHQFINHVKLAF